MVYLLPDAMVAAFGESPFLESDHYLFGSSSIPLHGWVKRANFIHLFRSNHGGFGVCFGKLDCFESLVYSIK
ncbi:hypothetical protein OUZ56_019818 [Daphnia magna]|uniref:Uncharacterized protein n=1 Tax=Daphnia magna TaxID=35525 RepID=A0ABQ9ZCQ6_9CRUS|nr:hypothetical protein OUZ56_019818 [Daphnia magna]